MKKFQNLGRSLNKLEMTKIIGGTDPVSVPGGGQEGCKGVLTCDPSIGCGNVETGSCECKLRGSQYLCV